MVKRRDLRAVLPALAVAAFSMLACADGDVIPFRNADRLELVDGASLEGRTLVVPLRNTTGYVVTGLRFEPMHHDWNRGIFMCGGIELKADMLPGTEAVFRVPLDGQAYRRCDRNSSVAPTFTEQLVEFPRERNRNTQFVAGTDHPEWGFRITTVRGHR